MKLLSGGGVQKYELTKSEMLPTLPILISEHTVRNRQKHTLIQKAPDTDTDSPRKIDTPRDSPAVRYIHKICSTSREFIVRSVPKYLWDHLGTQMGRNFSEIGHVMGPNFSKSSMQRKI